MDYSHLLRSSVPQIARLEAYGFSRNGSVFTLKKNVPQTDFYCVILIENGNVSAQVYDSLTDDRYALFDMVSANGAFIGELRTKVGEIVNEIREKCFESRDLHEQYLSHLLETYQCVEEFPWEGSDEYSVFRCKNNKWFALMMKIPFKCLGFQSDEKVWVVNLKADADLIPSIVDKNSVFPAYHMNKKYWITVLLTAVTDFEKLCQLTERSHQLVESKISSPKAKK